MRNQARCDLASRLLYAVAMKKITRKLALDTVTIRQLDQVRGGATAPRTWSCLPPRSDGCYTDATCPTNTR